MRKPEDDLPIPEDLIEISGYQVLCLLSDQSAGQSKVFLVSLHGQRYAIKVFEKDKHFKDEVGFLQKMDFKHIVKMHHHLRVARLLRKNGEVQQWPAIILQFAQKGDLSQYWRVAKKFSPPTCKTLFKWMLLSIKHMNQKGIAHRDLKLQNFLLTQNFILKAADFGYSALNEGSESDGILRDGKGTNIYWAPEVHRRCYKGLDRDIFAAVIILFLLYTGYPPFTSATPQNDKYRLFKEGSKQDCEKYWEKISRNINWIPNELKEIFQRSFIEDPERRLNLNSLLAHPWINSEPASEEMVQAELGSIYLKMQEKDDKTKEIERTRKKFYSQEFNHDLQQSQTNKMK